jgi:hypothetical protein
VILLTHLAVMLPAVRSQWWRSPPPPSPSPPPPIFSLGRPPPPPYFVGRELSVVSCVSSVAESLAVHSVLTRAGGGLRGKVVEGGPSVLSERSVEVVLGPKE